MVSFIEWNGQLCMSKKIDFVVDVTLPFVKRWIKFLYHQVSTRPTESVYDTLSFLSLSWNRAYSSGVMDDLNVSYATM